MKRIVSTLALAITLAVFGGTMVAPTASAATAPAFSACKTEDSTKPCKWNAKKQGNGKGKSFYVMPSRSKVHYNPSKNIQNNIKIYRGSIVYDVNLKSKKDGYVKKNKRGGWTLVCAKGLKSGKFYDGTRWYQCKK